MLIFNSILLGLGLAMDAFSVSLVNGMKEPHMGKGRMLQIAGTFAGFQFAMPMIGWICVRTIADTFREFQKFIPWIALILLVFIGGKMLVEGIRGKKEEEAERETGTGNLLMQGIATSIDALSVGFTMAELTVPDDRHRPGDLPVPYALKTANGRDGIKPLPDCSCFSAPERLTSSTLYRLK